MCVSWEIPSHELVYLEPQWEKHSHSRWKNAGRLVLHLLECHRKPQAELISKVWYQKTVWKRGREKSQKMRKYQVSKEQMIQFLRIKVVWKRA